jgi:hypothetical protein
MAYRYRSGPTARSPTVPVPSNDSTFKRYLGTPAASYVGSREDWLQHIVDAWRPLFARLGYEVPATIHVSVGRPPRSAWTGACYPGIASDDGYPHLFVHPVLSDSTRVAGVVIHQLCHVAFGGTRTHGLQFRHLATAVGLIGKMTATMEGPHFLAVMPGIIDRYGPYPHAALRQLRGLDKTSGTRLIRVRCPACGYLLRATQRWLKVGVPTCPNDRCPSYGEPMEIG